MGSSGKKHHQHLPKVGTKQELAYEQHMEREAIIENFGIHPDAHRGASRAVLWIVGVVIALLMAAGALTLALQ